MTAARQDQPTAATAVWPDDGRSVAARPLRRHAGRAAAAGIRRGLLAALRDAWLRLYRRRQDGAAALPRFASDRDLRDLGLTRDAVRRHDALQRRIWPPL